MCVFVCARGINRMYSDYVEQVIFELLSQPDLANECVSWVTKSSALQTCSLAHDYSSWWQTLHGSGALLEPPLTIDFHPCARLPNTMVSVEPIIQEMSGHDAVVPTMIANTPSVGEVVLGEVLAEVSCRYLAAGQALMIVGGYVVRGIRLACGKRANAIRNQTGAFDVVPPGGFGMALPISRRPSPLQTPRAISSNRLQIVGTPSPISAMLPMLEAQAGGQSLPTVPATIQHFEQLQQQ